MKTMLKAFDLLAFRSGRSREMWVVILLVSLGASSFIYADQNQSGFSDSEGFPLDTNDPDPMRNIGFADSGGFELNTAGISGALPTGMQDSGSFVLDTQDFSGSVNLESTGFSDSGGFQLDTQDFNRPVDLANSGFSDSGGFQLDTSDGNASGAENNQSGFSDSGGFELDTRNANPMDGIGFSDSGGFELDTRNPSPMEEIGYAESGGFELNTLDGSSVSGLGFSDSGGFELDTRDSNSEGVNTDLTGFGDTPGFSLDTTDGNGTDSNATGDQLVTVSGTVFYDGVVPGAAYVWALEANGSTAAEQILPAGEGNYTLTVAQGKAYDFKAFIDGTGNGYPNNGEVWKHFLDWNQTLGGFNLTQVDGNLSGIDFHLSDKDADFDGFLDWHEYLAGTGINEHNSTPGLDFGLVAHWNFDETNGTVLADLSGNELNGTLQGFNGGATRKNRSP